jgi:hypothetical protein
LGISAANAVETRMTVPLYLRAAAAREAPRLEAIEADFEARRELPPWDRDTKGVVEDSD